MNIVVTGAAGYIGAPAVAALLADGHIVAGVDCLRFGGTAVLGSYLTRRFSLAAADIRDRDAVTAAVSGADAVVHLARIGHLIDLLGQLRRPHLSRDIP
jgi:dTDP-L-rhamnose 4-epimerase